MDIAVAILQLKTNPQKFSSPFDSTNFEILLVDERISCPPMVGGGGGGGFVPEPSTANVINDSSNRNNSSSLLEIADKLNNNINNNYKSLIHLPRSRITFDQEPAEIAADLAVRTLNNFGVKNAAVGRFRRAVPVALWKSEPSSPSHSSYDHSMAGFSAALFCASVLPKDKVVVTNSLIKSSSSGRYRYHSFDQILLLCKNSSSSVDVETRHLLLRLEEWLKEKHKSAPNFLHRLFVRSLAGGRILSCAHNPAHKDETRSCNRVTLTRVTAQIHHQNDPTTSASPTTGDVSELDEDARYANEALTRMIVLEKCDCVMNPFFGSGLPYKIGHDQQLMAYFAHGRVEPTVSKTNQSSNNSDGSDSGSWLDDYPLQRAAYNGSADQIKKFLKDGYDPNQLDKDSWAPIHYAAWYGHLSVLQALLNYGNCSVNVRNKNGSTPLHFAAWCGHQYVVELLLSHPDISVVERDKDGKLALDLCDCVPKAEWQAISKLLKSAERQKLPKITIDLMDGSNVMLNLVNEADTTVAQLHQQMCAELKLTESSGKLFALWLCSDSLQLQLNEKQRPLIHMNRWSSKVSQWADSDDVVDEKPKLYFRRDALIGLSDEKKAKLTDTALALLFHEARNNFLNGLYPCDEHDVIFLSATVLQILNGDYDSKKDKAFFASEKSLVKLLPHHKLKEKNAKWVQEIISEHKQVTSKAQKSLTGLQNTFLSLCQNLRVYGSAFFSAMIYVNKPFKSAVKVHVGVNDLGLHLINSDTKALYQSFQYQHIEWTFVQNKPYIEFKAKDSAIRTFTLQTRQANMVHNLITRWSEISKNNPSARR